jgi:hypothetical protein
MEYDVIRVIVQHRVRNIEVEIASVAGNEWVRRIGYRDGFLGAARWS